MSKKQDTPDPGLLLDAWNENRGSLPAAIGLPANRRKHALARLKEEPNLFVWEGAVARLAASPFASGENDRAWVATIDFLLRPDTLTKILEGVYDRKITAGAVVASGATQDPELLESIRKHQERGYRSRLQVLAGSSDPEIAADARKRLEEIA